MSIEFEIRVELVIDELVASVRALGGRGIWTKLESLTGVKRQAWKNVHERRQRPTTELVAAIGKLRPKYAFWLVTGITDAANGHIAPSTATTFPERAHLDDPWSERYFESAIEFKDQILADETKTHDDVRRALERKEVFSHWWDSELATKIYGECSSQSYSAVRKAWEKRNQERQHHLKKLFQNAESAKAHKLGVTDPRTDHQHPYFLFYESRHDDTKD
ncbi:hypothetical protein [Alcaligenes faecalis]|uniref:Uncharacterized protein n=1 Tax=Alcaligenes faecalis TaxID=511 RepID=A0AAE9H571_ALCFA|nr:hypothetical protein [Alcaligenes faecalis]UPL20183.1 hypothetical protein MXF72_12185 [Alcaligenes faecalis]